VEVNQAVLLWKILTTYEITKKTGSAGLKEKWNVILGEKSGDHSGGKIYLYTTNNPTISKVGITTAGGVEKCRVVKSLGG